MTRCRPSRATCTSGYFTYQNLAYKLDQKRGPQIYTPTNMRWLDYLHFDLVLPLFLLKSFDKFRPQKVTEAQATKFDKQVSVDCPLV